MPIFSLKKASILALSSLVVAATPVAVFAQESATTERATTETKKEIQDKTRNKATVESKCQAIDKITAKIQSQLNERKSKVEAKRTTITTDMDAKRTEHDKEIITKRAQWDKIRESNFEKLRSKAITTEQKEAVEEYIASMKKAIADRRAANDAAIVAFRSEVSALKVTARQSVEINIATTSSSIDQAITDAKAACVSGQSSPDTIKQDLKKAIDNARTQSKTTRESTIKNEQLKSAIDRRNETIKTNAEAFQQTTEAAREKLRSAFED